MKKADAIRTVIEEIKAQNRSSLNADDFESLQKKYRGKFTTNIALDFQAAAQKAGIESFEDLSLEDMLPKRRATAAEIKAGVEPGKQLTPNVTGSPKAKSGRVAIKTPINITDDGVNLVLKMMQETGKNVRGSITELTNRFNAFRKTNRDRAGDLNRYINEAFPDGIESITKQLDEFRAYEQYMYESGLLKDDDPPTGKDEKNLFTFKKLDAELGTLSEGGQNRRSRRGKEIFAIKEKGGVPVIAGRDKNGKIIEDKSRVRPHNLVISDKGIEEAKKVSLPIYVQTKITPQIEMQDRQRKAAARREARPAIPETPTIQERTAKFISPPEEQEKPQPRPLPSDEPKPMSERTKSILGIIKKGGRGTAKALIPGVGLGLTVIDELAAATPVADATMEGFEARKRAGPDYEELRSADEEAFSAMEKQQVSDRLKGPRGFLYLD
tara:strand:- start:1024 stop:2343 length:1320 start_codon:yes stop_codon:yes gene_type:complete